MNGRPIRCDARGISVGRQRTRLPRIPWLQPVAAVVLLVAAGCEQEVDLTYAAVRGTSINGISAFVQLLRDTGHSVTIRQHLPAVFEPDIETLVVFDDSFTGLEPSVAELLLGFLFEAGPRTLLLVLRDNDGAIDYLRDVLAREDLSPGHRHRAEELLEECERALATATSMPRPASYPYPDGLGVHPRSSAGEAVAVRLEYDTDQPAERITARWELRRRLEPDDEADPLWTAGGERLLVRRSDGEAVILVLASAAPLLNGGLVDPGNRRLAEEIVALLPVTGRLLVTGSAKVGKGLGGTGDGGGDGDDPGDGENPSPWRLLRIQPLPWVAAQVILAMALFCWCTSPIFGRPRRSSPFLAQDFSHHVAALANLFDKAPAAGAAFARERLEAWLPTGGSSGPRGSHPPHR